MTRNLRGDLFLLLVGDRIPVLDVAVVLVLVVVADSSGGGPSSSSSSCFFSLCCFLDFDELLDFRNGDNHDIDESFGRFFSFGAFSSFPFLSFWGFSSFARDDSSFGRGVMMNEWMQLLNVILVEARIQRILQARSIQLPSLDGPFFCFALELMVPFTVDTSADAV